MRVLVSGAGIAGLSLANALRLRGIAPLVLERAPELRGGGYMVDFFGTGYDAAERMGLLPALEEIHDEIPRLAFLGPDGREKYSLPYAKVRRRLFAGRHFNFMRGDLERVLYEAVRDHVEVRFGTTITRIEQREGGVGAVLSDGSEVEADVLVGADGLHSATRRALFGDETKFLRYLGYDTAAFIMPDTGIDPRLISQFSMLTTDGRQVATYPGGDGRLATFFLQRRERTLRPRSAAEKREALHAAFGGLGWIVPQLLAACGEGCDPYYDEVSQVVLPAWSRGRVTLVGDAAWCVSLLAGQGASLAVSGPLTLAEELAEPGAVEWALKRYEARHRPVAEEKQEEGRRTAKWFIPQGRVSAVIRDWALRMALLPGVSHMLRRRFLA